MTETTRFNIDEDEFGSTSMVEADEGVFIFYTDHIAALEAVKATAKPLNERAIRKAGQVAIDHLIDTGLTFEASGDDLADYLTRIVDACVRAALAKEGE